MASADIRQSEVLELSLCFSLPLTLSKSLLTHSRRFLIANFLSSLVCRVILKKVVEFTKKLIFHFIHRGIFNKRLFRDPLRELNAEARRHRGAENFRRFLQIINYSGNSIA